MADKYGTYGSGRVEGGAKSSHHYASKWGHFRLAHSLEVDGQQHYAVDGRPDPSTYARTVQADRDLRLAGYEVYRFAGVELQRVNALEVLTDFFTRLME